MMLHNVWIYDMFILIVY